MLTPVHTRDNNIKQLKGRHTVPLNFFACGQYDCQVNPGNVRCGVLVLQLKIDVVIKITLCNRPKVIYVLTGFSEKKRQIFHQVGYFCKGAVFAFFKHTQMIYAG